MRVMHFSEENIHEILRLLAGVLHTGDIEFATAGGAQVTSKSGQHTQEGKNRMEISQQRSGLSYHPTQDVFLPLRVKKQAKFSSGDLDRILAIQ